MHPLRSFPGVTKQTRDQGRHTDRRCLGAGCVIQRWAGNILRSTMCGETAPEDGALGEPGQQVVQLSTRSPSAHAGHIGLVPLAVTPSLLPPSEGELQNQETRNFSPSGNPHKAAQPAAGAWLVSA